MPDWPFFSYILYNVFGEGSNSVYLSGQLATFLMISEEHLENYEISFANVNGHRELVNLRILGILITYCVCDFLFYVYPYMKKENMML